MSKATDKLKSEWKAAEDRAIKLQNEKDKAIDAIQSKYRDKQRKAVDEAAAKQKKFLDEEVRESLRDRPDGEAVAEALGIDLG